jgi:outer membrane lipoprotein-sorting protein/predicted small secreted protein
MKRFITLALVVVMVLGSIGLAACNGGDGGGATTPPAGGTTTPAGGETTTPPPDETTTPPPDTMTPEETLMDILGLGAAITGVQWDSVVTAGGETTTIRCWIEGDRMRTETDVEGETVATIIDYSAGTMYLLYPALATAFEVPFDPEAAESALAESQYITDYDYDILGTDYVDDMECLIVQYTAGGATVKMWLWVDTGFPVRVETTTSSGTVIAVCQNILFGDIDDSLFEVPAGYTIIGL